MKRMWLGVVILLTLIGCGKPAETAGPSLQDFIEHGAILDAAGNYHSVSCLRTMNTQSEFQAAVANKTCVVGSASALKAGATNQQKSLAFTSSYYYYFNPLQYYNYQSASSGFQFWSYLLKSFAGYNYYNAFGYQNTVLNSSLIATSCLGCLTETYETIPACMQQLNCVTTPQYYY